MLTSAVHLAITPEGFSRRQSKDLTAISNAKLLGQQSGTAWAVGLASTNIGLFLVGGSRCGQRQARLRKTCYNGSTTLAILTQFDRRTVKKVSMLCRYRAVITDFFSLGNELGSSNGTSQKLLLTKAAPIA